MQVLINTVGKGFNFLAEMIGTWLGGMWGGFLGIAQFFAAWAVTLVGSIITFVVEVVLTMATVMVGWLPALPDAPTVGSADFLNMANQYVPVSETMVLVGVWGAIFSGVLVVKFIRFISPVSS